MSKDGPIYHKFDVTRTDGKHKPGEKHHDCCYFVLDTTHDPFAVAALWAYAAACQETYPALAESVRREAKYREQCRRDPHD